MCLRTGNYWLCHYLTGMGAKIRIRENGCICIEGVEKLEAGYSCIPPDRIVAGTYLMAAAATRGEIILKIRLWRKWMESWTYIGKWVDNAAG